MLRAGVVSFTALVSAVSAFIDLLGGEKAEEDLTNHIISIKTINFLLGSVFKSKGQCCSVVGN